LRSGRPKALSITNLLALLSRLKLSMTATPLSA